MRYAQKMFPILRDPIIRAIPWQLIAPHEKQADRNHGQTLARLAERGGLSCDEAVAVLKDQRWQSMDEWDARDELLQLTRRGPHD